MISTPYKRSDASPSGLSEAGHILALLPWGDVIEDYLDSIGVSLESFCREMTGGWMFGYIQALHKAGVRSVLFCISRAVTAPCRYIHGPTGTAIWVLPVPRVYSHLRRFMVRPYGWDLKEMFGTLRGHRRLLYPLIRDVATYCTTPLRLLARYLRLEGCNGILCQEYETARFDLCVLLGRLLSLPVFASFQGGDWHISRMEKFTRPRALRLCSGLIIGSGTEQRRVQAAYRIPPAKIGRIFNPIDLSSWGHVEKNKIQARGVLGIAIKEKVVAWHGRVEMHRKGLDMLLKAWKRVCEQRPRASLCLLLVGTGADAEEMRRAIASWEVPNVRWIDLYVLDRQEILRYLAAADVYAFPSRHEGFPVAPIEAMAAGLPIVSARAPGMPDILEQGELSGGILVARDDTEGFADALGRLLDDDALRRVLGDRARRRIEGSFAIEPVGRQLLDFLVRRGLRSFRR